ncbi:MAG TPA: ABC transporter ATP-binding protein, partial [Candidatus Bathyarchaeia archaeon]|nr:ABC transporter ATP-binding protein [Candidatus Bathyarchaeia archaeon]
ALEISNLTAGYGKLEILHGVSATVEQGAIVAILGPNGSGKSTLLKTVFGLTSTYDGSIKFEGQDITHAEPYQVARRGISYLPQIENLYLDLTIKENLLMGGYILPDVERETNLEMALELFPELKGLLREPAYTLSGGQKQMAVMARALMRKPTLMMLDEPSANLSPRIVTEVFEKIQVLRRSGMSVLIVEQNTSKALEISDYAYLLVSGRINYHGKAKELATNKEFGKLFLGL